MANASSLDPLRELRERERERERDRVKRVGGRDVDTHE